VQFGHATVRAVTQTFDDILAASPVFAGLRPAHLAAVSGCARNVDFTEGTRLFGEDNDQDTFYLVRRGRFALSVSDAARGALIVETIEPGEVVGWSWLFVPYRSHFDAVATEDVRAVAFDAACLRQKCEADHELGYELMRRFATVVIDRLEHTRLRLLDVYGSRRVD